MYEVALALQLDQAGNPAHASCAPHDYHRTSNVASLTSTLLQHDGAFWDVRVDFYGMDDSIRLRPGLTSSIRSVPALAWKERVYTALLKRGCHHDEVSVELSELVLPSGLGLARPLSLLPGPLPRSPPQRLQGQRHFQAQTPAQEKAADAKQRDKVLLRHILEEDPVFDVRHNNQLQRIELLAQQEVLARNETREEVLMKPGNKLPPSVFETEWAVFLRERPGWSLSIAGVSSRYVQGEKVPVPAGSDSDSDAAEGAATTGNATQSATAEQKRSKQISNLQDLPTESGFAACGAVLRYRRVRHLSPPAPYSDGRNPTVEVDGTVFAEGQLIESREDVIWEWRHFVGNNSTRQAAEYTALAKALELCARKGFAPLVVFTRTKDLPRNMRHKPIDEKEMRVQMAGLNIKQKQKAMERARAEAAALVHTPNMHPAIKGGSFYIFEAHTQCAQYILNMQAQTQLAQHSMPEYYNILGLPTVKSQRSKNPAHTNSVIYRDVAKTLTVPVGQLLQVTGKPSEFAPWCDEMFSRTAIGKYCSVPMEQAVTFTVLTDARMTPVYTSRMAEVMALARQSQEDGFIIARGLSAPELAAKEPADLHNSLKKSNSKKDPDPALANIHVSWLGETKSGTAAMDPAFNRGLLPGVQAAKEQVAALAHAWDGKIVGVQPEEGEYTKFPGEPTAPLLQTVVFDEQPAHYLRCPCHANVLNTYCANCAK